MERGISASDIEIIAGAAGGPKWIILYELDKYLINEFLPKAQQTIHFVGGSIGAWRSAAYVLKDASSALDRLKEGYLNQRYSRPLTKDEVTNTCQDIIKYFLGPEGMAQVLDAPNRKLHIITSKAHFNTHSKSDRFLKYQLGKAALSNLLSRKGLNRSFTREVFSNTNNSIIKNDGIRTVHHVMDEATLIPALRASGAIPVNIHPVHLNGYEYWDGGITDYHLDLSYRLENGIVFYPHFLPHITPGWFDKFHPYRQSQYHDDTLLLYPSKDFIHMLPDKRLTSRVDFDTYAGDPDLRIKKWYEAADLGKYLVDDFLKLLNPGILRENLDMF
jgi:hypothetical protein